MGLVGWILVCFGAAWGGSIFPIGAWYDSLNKPTWAPPDALFAPVWSVLYTLMAIAAWLVWKQGGFRVAKAPLIVFLVQLTLNTMWSWCFFGAHRIDWALWEIVMLFAAIVFTVSLFFRRSRTAAALMLPYLAWVMFAAALNFQYWRLNG